MNVLLFAKARELAGASIDVHVPAGGTVGDVRRALAATVLASLVERCAIAVNEEYAGDEVVLKPDDRVALLPPVSGG